MDHRVRHIQISAISQICIGLICFTLGIVQEGLGLGRKRMGILGFIGIWFGILYFFSGLCGIRASKRITLSAVRQVVSGYLCISNTAVVFTGFMILFFGFYGSAFRVLEKEYNPDTLGIFSVCFVFIGILEFGVGIWASISCCHLGGLCTTREQMQPGHGQQDTNPQNEDVPCVLHFMVELPDGTFAALPAQIRGPMVEPGGIPVYKPVYETGTQLPPPPPYEPATPQNIDEDDEGETTAL